MRKVVGFILHRNFEKSYIKLTSEQKTAFKERRNMMSIDVRHPLLNDHSLQGKWKGYRSINVTGDIRAIYKMEGFFAIFYDIGSHGYLYGV